MSLKLFQSNVPNVDRYGRNEHDVLGGLGNHAERAGVLTPDLAGCSPRGARPRVCLGRRRLLGRAPEPQAGLPRVLALFTAGTRSLASRRRVLCFTLCIPGPGLGSFAVGLEILGVGGRGR